MDSYIVLLAALGAVILLTAWLPLVLKELPLSLPIFCLVIGALLFIAPFPLPEPIPLEHPDIAKRATEMVVIVSLMGAGLRIDRPFSLRGWGLTWRMLGVTMPLSIATVALLAWLLLGLDLPTAILLGAVLAPTDPVLASDVEVGPPNSEEEDEVRFALTSEAGLNDGLAFPFVNLAIALAAAASLGPQDWAMEWLAIDVIWKLGVGLAAGLVMGRVMGLLVFRMPKLARLSGTGDGLVAIGITFLTYAVTEMMFGYGFLAVFVAAISLRAYERGHEYHEELHDFSEQIERVLMMVLLMLLGGAVVHGLLGSLDWRAIVFAAVLILLIRPLSGWLGLTGFRRPARERAVIAFYGIRGLGSLYYLSYALTKESFEQPDYLWAVAGLVVISSIFLHGITVTPVMRRLDAARQA